MKILITGICGFVGSTLAKQFVASGVASQIIGIDSLVRSGSHRNRDELAKRGIQVIHGDIRSQSDVDSLPAADWVIDAAANPSVLAGMDGRTSSRQLMEHNLLGTIQLLEYCKQHHAGFVLLSTSRVYAIDGLLKISLQVEQDQFMPVPGQTFCAGISVQGVSEAFSTSPPVSLYGSSKLASEQLALEYGATFGFPVWINRCGLLAGAGQFGHPAQGICAYWIHSFKEGKPLRYTGFGGHGYQVRDCLHPRDLVPLLVLQMKEPFDGDQTTKPRIINVSGGTGQQFSLKQLTHWCQRNIADMQVSADATDRKYDIPWLILDHGLAEQVWNWRPTTSLEAIFHEIAEFANQNPQWLEVTAA